MKAGRGRREGRAARIRQGRREVEKGDSAVGLGFGKRESAKAAGKGKRTLRATPEDWARDWASQRPIPKLWTTIVSGVSGWESGWVVTSMRAVARFSRRLLL